MNNQNLIIYQFATLHQILKELDLDLNLNLIEAKNEEFLRKKVKDLKNYLVISKKKISHIDHQLIFNFPPIKIFKLIENIHVEFMKKNFSDQSRININNYIVDLNSREMLLKDLKLKLTEKEVNTIIYLSKKNKPVNIEDLEKNVWQYQPDVETHTVETHIYRLRKKILQTFKDQNFIISEKNGYQIK
jgi:DNA-binding response OmpR family regulator